MRQLHKTNRVLFAVLDNLYECTSYNQESASYVIQVDYSCDVSSFIFRLINANSVRSN